MGIFDPEHGEFGESGYEAKKFSSDVEDRLREALDRGAESFPDVVQCPVASCRMPLTVVRRDEAFDIRCPKCGWTALVKRNG